MSQAAGLLNTYIYAFKTRAGCWNWLQDETSRKTLAKGTATVAVHRGLPERAIRRRLIV